MKNTYVLIIILSLIISACKPTEYAHLNDGLYANLETNRGEILLKLEFELTPVTVANFVSLAEGTNDFVVDSLKGKPYYNGTIFHRVIPNFMIQGGDRLGTGEGNPGYNFNDEFPKYVGDSLVLKHAKAGVLSMANSGPNSNGSQFFITHKETPWLDGAHTVFGNVESGQQVVDSIVQYDTIKKVEIIKVGKAAKSFKANKVFSNYYKVILEEKIKKDKALKVALAATMKKFNENYPKATEYPSGLKMVIVETKNGQKPKVGNKVSVNYAGYFSDGKLFETSIAEIAKAYGVYDAKRDQKNGYKPFTIEYSPEARLIAGFSEGLQQMKIGDKAILFIPSHLGYGKQGAGGLIPPSTDLVFEVELMDKQ
ncbi:peptidylprolyl isomerase [Lutibacter sp. HS1-25]|uniref:peptidylprolyl isomerase n=1 Tax=Lutibacter sp. HS1-25 TaxID=2485000 RepID=UPI001012E145|nr:peptidylprolyl isomerase [Lutibacter sp. HS1-25]RXP47065.1 peptidylprolyl isomerase [Lutibacter sp. HS1-25]